MMTLEKAIQKCIDKINLSDDGESADIYKYMFKYKVIRELDSEKQEEVYDTIARVLGY